MVAPTLLTYQERFFDVMACLMKLEVTPGTDVIPAAADAIILSNVTFKPMNAKRIERNLMLPWLGNQGVILTDFNATIQGDIELAGSGVPGTPPKWGTAFRICGMSETIVATTSVAYARVQTPVDYASIYFVMDGVRHILLGCQADASVNFVDGIPHLTTTITGMLGIISDQPNPAVSQTGWLVPEPVSPDVTSLSMHGVPMIAESLVINLGNTITPRFNIGQKKVVRSGYSASGTAVIQATKLAVADWFAKVKPRTRGVIDLTHGLTAGNIINLHCAAVEVSDPTPGNSDGITNYSLTLDVCTTNGADDVVLTLT